MKKGFIDDTEESVVDVEWTVDGVVLSLVELLEEGDMMKRFVKAYRRRKGKKMGVVKNS